MAAAKKPPRCTKVAGHDATLVQLEAELARVGRQYADLILDKGPRCNHSTGTVDERNARLMDEKAQVAILLQKERKRADELEAQVSKWERESLKQRQRLSRRSQQQAVVHVQQEVRPGDGAEDDGRGQARAAEAQPGRPAAPAPLGW